MTMLNTLPTVEEMIAALSSPIVPDSYESESMESESESEAESMELSTDDMIKLIFQAVMQPPAAS